MAIASRLAELGIELPNVAAPVAAYVPATKVGNQVWTSGQLPLIDGALPTRPLREVDQHHGASLQLDGRFRCLPRARAHSDEGDVSLSGRVRLRAVGKRVRDLLGHRDGVGAGLGGVEDRDVVGLNLPGFAAVIGVVAHE